MFLYSKLKFTVVIDRFEAPMAKDLFIETQKKIDYSIKYKGYHYDKTTSSKSIKIQKDHLAT